jgi:single-strand DNA-binding protein
MGKGRPILVEGRLHYHQWEAQDGSKRSKLDVTVENFTFLGGGGPREQTGAQPARAAAPGSAPPDHGSPGDDYGPPVDDSGVPF